MKHYMFAIAFISLICFNTASTLFKVTKKNKKAKSKATTQSGCSNSWNGGYQVSIWAALKSGNLKKQLSCCTYAPRLENPTNQNEHLGWTFYNCSGNKDVAQKFITPAGNNNYYVPYRFISGSSGYTNPSGSNKYIEMWVTNDQNEVFQFKCNLPYKLIGWYINDKEGNKMCAAINTQRTTVRNNIVETKTVALSASSQVCTNGPLLEAASSKGADISKIIAKINADQAKLKEDIQKVTKDRETAQQVYDSLATKTAAKQTEVNTIKARINHLESQKNAFLKQVQDLKGKKTASKELISKYKDQMDAAKKAFDNDIGTLKTLAPERDDQLVNASAACMKCNIETVSSAFNAIVPA